MARPKKSEAVEPATAAKRRGRPKGSTNKKAGAARATSRSNGGRQRKGPGRPMKQGLASRIDAMVRELEGLRAEVGKLEEISGALRKLRLPIG